MFFRRKKVDPNNIPKHIGIILDGNGRWAVKKGLSRSMGHKAGMEAVTELVNSAIRYGIKIITLYAFSTENWKRDNEEIDYIFSLVRENMQDISERYKTVRIRTMGDLSRLPKDLREKLTELTQNTSNRDGLIVNIAINYGARSEIIRAINLILSEIRSDSSLHEITEESFLKYLYTNGLSDPDLIIRTSGEQRLSNFMLYQCAYSEFYFPKINWPDFDKNELRKAIIEFQSRNRRYGGIKKAK